MSNELLDARPLTEDTAVLHEAIEVHKACFIVKISLIEDISIYSVRTMK